MDKHALCFMLLPLLLSACSNQPAHHTVQAAASPCLALPQQSNLDALYGYGTGNTLAEAKQQAYADISAQLKVQVSSVSLSSVQKHDTQVSSSFDQQISSHTESRFSGLELECLDQHSMPGSVQVTLRFDRRPLERKIAADLVQQLGYTPAKILWQAPQSIATAPLLNRLNEQLRQQQGSGQHALPVKLFHQPNSAQWTVQLGPLPVHLEAEQMQLLVNWQALQKGHAQLAVLSMQGELLNRQIAAETEYRLALQHPDPGYAQLVGVYENGDIDLLRSNLPLTGNQSRIVPEQGGVFEASVLPEQSLTTDTLILIVTAQKLSDADLARLHPQNSTTRLQLLLQALENIAADIAVVQLVVR